MFTRRWLLLTVERMAKTAAQTFISMVGSNEVGPRIDPDWIHLQWNHIGIGVTVMTLLSLAFSILSTPIGPPEDPSII